MTNKSDNKGQPGINAGLHLPC